MPTDLSGLWTFAQGDHTKDNRFALEVQHTFPDGKAGPHGTYFKKLWYRIYLAADDRFYIFNDEGDCNEFVFVTPEALAAMGIKAGDFRKAEMPEVWKSTNHSFEFSLPQGDKYAPQGKTTGRIAVLRLKPVSKARPDLRAKWYPAEDWRGEAKQTQFIYYDPTDQTLYWLPDKPNESVEGLQLRKFEWATDVDPGGDKPFRDVFGDTFAGASHLGQLAYPFYGFNLNRPEFGSQSANMWSGFLNPGTDALPEYGKTNPKQDIQHALLFEFPRSDSRDYERGVGIGDNPNLPLGLTGEAVHYAQEHAHTEEIASTYDTARSWSMTLGGNGGMGKMLSLGESVGFKDQVRTQLEQKSRYTISRKVKVEYIFWLKAPVLRLQKRFIDGIRSRLVELLSGHQPSWENFVNTFGTHYVHAMTLGSIDCVVMRHSLAGEVLARTKGFNFKATASGALGKAKSPGPGGGLSASFSDEWKQTTGFTIATDDIDGFQLGSPEHPVTIFLDLRPISELLNPIFFEFNPADDWRGDWQKYSPFIWYDLSKSLIRYLGKLGLNQPMEKAAGKEMTPRLVKLSSPSGKFRIDNRYGESIYNPWSVWFMPIAWPGPALHTGPVFIGPLKSEMGMYVSGNVKFESALEPKPPANPGEEQPAEPKLPAKDTIDAPCIIEAGGRLFQSERVEDDRYKSDGRLYCLIATRRGAKAKAKLKVDLNIKYCDDSRSPGVLANFSADLPIEEGAQTHYHNEVNPNKVSIYYNMDLDLKWEEVPWG